MPLLPFAMRAAFPYASSHFYHIRSLRERGHSTLLFPFGTVPCCFRLAQYLTVSVWHSTLLIPSIQLPICRPVGCDLPARQLPPTVRYARAASV
ncbi:hypothetical protein [Methanimicrococcus hacksteinii]|uniref:hypothetical protein n=1 Tax=Methanimicrococcus hacksteinii TaxID=3028293 RepID=UPI00298EDA3F|nr:hypothetical protein [Methanimicrococcus sp. At1]